MEKDAITKYLDAQKFKMEIGKAKERFAFKSFTERFRLVKAVASGFKFTLPVFSIATGVFWLYAHINSLVGIEAISGLLALAIIVLWELAKANLITNASELFYIRKWAMASSVAGVALLLQAGSMYASLEGAKEAYAMQDKRVEALGIGHKAQRDSIALTFDTRIASAKQYAEQFKNANTVRDISGKDVVKYGAPTRQYTELVKAAALAEADKREALKDFDATAKQEHGKAVQDSGKATGNIVWLALVIEMLILAANWFLVHYDYEAAFLEWMLTREEGQLDDYKNFAQVYHIYKMNPMLLGSGSLPMPQKQIGFHAGKNKDAPSALKSSLDPSHKPSLNQALGGQNGQEISRNFQEMGNLGQEHGQALGSSHEAFMGPVEKAISAGLLQELRSMKANGQKMAYQDITARYALSIPQIQQIRKLYNI